MKDSHKKKIYVIGGQAFSGKEIFLIFYCAVCALVSSLYLVIGKTIAVKIVAFIVLYAYVLIGLLYKEIIQDCEEYDKKRQKNDNK